MTITSIAKKIIGDNRCAIEKIELETVESAEQLVIKARPYTSMTDADAEYAAENAQCMTKAEEHVGGGHLT